MFFLLNDGVAALEKATGAGTSLVFGYLGGGALPFAEVKPGASFILAFKAFPLVLVISALASLLLYWGILQRIVAGFAFVLRNTLGIGGPLGLGAAVHIFVGMVEAPLLVRPYLLKMSRGELFALMSCGMAGIAGTVMVIYASLLGPVIPDALGHILIASVISTPGALAIAAIMVPFDGHAQGCAELVQTDPPSSFLEAITRGTNDGIYSVASIVAMLIVIVALVQICNAALGVLPHGGFALTWLLVVLFLAAKNESGEAERCFREAIRIDPSKPDAHYRLGRLWSSFGRRAAGPPRTREGEETGRGGTPAATSQVDRPAALVPRPPDQVPHASKHCPRDLDWFVRISCMVSALHFRVS